MVILRFDFASQLRREPGRVINPIEVNFLRIISLLDLVVLSRTMKMILRKIGRMIASRVVVVEAVQTRAESMQSLWRLALPRASSAKRRSRRLMERCTQNTRFLMAILNGTIGEGA